LDICFLIDYELEDPSLTSLELRYLWNSHFQKVAVLEIGRENRKLQFIVTWLIVRMHADQI